MKVLTGFAVVTDAVGKRIAYTFSELNEHGMVVDSNVKESYVVLEQDELNLITSIEEKIKTRLV